MADTFPEITIALADYQPHKRNYNRHPASQIERLRASLRKFGQPRNIVVWRKYFVAGHGVAQAAMAEGWATLRANEIPADWPETRVMAFLAADNELSRLSDPDQAALAALIDEARQFDGELLAAIGYDDREFAELLKEVGKTTTTTNGDAPPQVDRADELRKLWQVEPGQLWRIGEHRLVCGDCTDAATVARVMGGEKAGIVVTDPPYGIGADKKKAHSSIRDNSAWADVNWDKKPADAQIAYIAGFCERVAIWGGNYFANILPATSGWLAWIKPQAGTDFSLADMELCWTSLNIAARCKEFNRRDGHDHPTQKPVDLIAWTIEKIDRDGTDLVVDFFAGSGTTLVACQNLKRKARAIELSPAYCGVILQRMRDAFPGIEIERING